MNGTTVQALSTLHEQGWAPRISITVNTPTPLDAGGSQRPSNGGAWSPLQELSGVVSLTSREPLTIKHAQISFEGTRLKSCLKVYLIDQSNHHRRNSSSYSKCQQRGPTKNCNPEIKIQGELRTGKVGPTLTLRPVPNSITRPRQFGTVKSPRGWILSLFFSVSFYYFQVGDTKKRECPAAVSYSSTNLLSWTYLDR